MTDHGTYALTAPELDRLHGLVEGHWSRDQIRLVGQQIAPKATMPELAHFLHVAKSRGLDPFARQVYAIHRNTKNKDGGWESKMTIQVGIDGYRLIADRSGEYVGNDEPVFEERDGVPVKASVTVWRLVKGERCGFTASARMSEYRQDKSPMWNRMPYSQLAKCAEALALRKAFPESLSGLYTDAEMDQADGDVIESEVVRSETNDTKPPKSDALSKLEKLLEGPAFGIAKQVREDLEKGETPESCLTGVLKFLDADLGQKEERRETQTPKGDSF